MFLAVLVGSFLLFRDKEQHVGALEAFPNGEDEVLLHDDGMITFRWNSLSLYGMHGAFTVSEQADRLSIAALTTPVLVRGMDTWSIVPIGFQWRSDRGSVLLPIPSAFQYAKLQALSAVSPVPRREQWYTSMIFPGALRLPMAEQRREDVLRMRYLTTLARQVEQERPIARMMQNDAIVVALSSRDGYRMLPSLLAELVDAPFDRSLLFPFLFQEEEGVLLALFHATFRDQAALLETDVLSPEARAVYHLSLPRSDLLPHALSKLAVSQWENDVVRELSGRTDPLPFLSTLLATVEDVVRECARHGYVERAERYIAVMRNLASIVELTPELQERLEDLPLLLTVSASVSPVVASSSSSHSSVSPLSVVEDPAIGPELAEREPAEWEDLRKRVIADLTAQGGMFISKTTIEPLSPTAVRVASLVLATSKGDELIDLTYDTEWQEVSDVIRGSTQYPYAVPLQQFVEWVKEE